MVLCRALLFAALASSANAIKVNQNKKLLPFDCYVDNGADYQGLMDSSGTGRKCKNWRDADVAGMGNNNFCRNPKGEKERPWCHTIDPEVDWEYCDVPECKDAGEPPEPWQAPDGAKSKGEKPCEYTPKDDAGFKMHEGGTACMDNKGETWWLITNKKHSVSDKEGCRDECVLLPGSEYFTFFNKKDDDGNNCGCYRECIPDKHPINDPNSFRLT